MLGILRGVGGEIGVHSRLKKLLSRLSVIWGSCPNPLNAKRKANATKQTYNEKANRRHKLTKWKSELSATEPSRVNALHRPLTRRTYLALRIFQIRTQYAVAKPGQVTSLREGRPGFTPLSLEQGLLCSTT